MNFMYLPERDAQQSIPPELAKELRTVRDSEINKTEQELERTFIAQNVPLGPCPDIVRRLAAYSRRVAAEGATEAELKRLEKLAAQVCEQGFKHLTRHYSSTGSFRLIRKWELYFFPFE